MSISNVILDINSSSVTPEERDIIAHPSVIGVILFSRNYHNKGQLTALITDLKSIKPDLIVAVDQEGGRVQRFREQYTVLPPMQHWGDMWKDNPVAAIEGLVNATTTMVRELIEVGVNLSITPVMDIDYGLNQVIGDRSFGSSEGQVTTLAKVVIDTMKDCGMTAVAKHFPGHGGVSQDSHFELPRDNRSKDDIWAADIRPFSELARYYDAVMPAHIIFSNINDELVSYSRYWLNDVLRNELGFEGVIMSDDLTMNAASHIGDYAARTEAALDAGCDILIACNNREGSIQVLEQSAKSTSGKRNDRVMAYRHKINSLLHDPVA